MSWVLAFALIVLLPDGQVGELRGRDARAFTFEQCLAALEDFRPALLPDAAPGGRVVAVRAACVPDAPPRDAAPAGPAPAAV